MATPKQRALIERIEDALTVSYEGKTIEEASLFITTHLPEFRKLGVPTPKQRGLIREMEKMLGIAFNGKTTMEASQFISRHTKAYREQLEILSSAMYEAMCVGDH